MVTHTLLAEIQTGTIILINKLGLSNVAEHKHNLQLSNSISGQHTWHHQKLIQRV